ncbi:MULTISPECIES: AbrB/MazE/SpoVT family DNA-binding domain-containing protein [Sphingobium]|jgi:antitoxin VapB|uniref:AbrB/MazE/SpoVT family DNA-binding domain-containing protein n=1 Tax=Sphingobium yanoikuyae TaxID=13690 RepID=A0A6M4G2V8_SPHYA|nr:AbrB/MazE/SpoVT family DNA-binding domain-containing protein [Sphingobium yanoikuyae]QJR01206.1 AbrB/MazE/SpoVT family DNA-binding domain-containing protein [Sphingobium yanoikuyae]RSU76527.1 AbrB/MazE/SpoVT family DNA-binding domain-containing protein [Sphingomonas sp. S-NIH.Pt3_0716]
MGEEYRAKVFKSGNSLALRLPKALGLQEGAEMRLREENGKFTLEPVDAPPRLIDVSKFAGKAPWLEAFSREEFDDSPRVWDDPDFPGFR